MNSELTKQALAKVGNPNVLINLVSRRVRQLTSTGGTSRPLVAETAGMGVADIALLEIIEGKMGWGELAPENPEEEEQAAARKRKRA